MCCIILRKLIQNILKLTKNVILMIICRFFDSKKASFLRLHILMLQISINASGNSERNKGISIILLGEMRRVIRFFFSKPVFIRSGAKFFVARVERTFCVYAFNEKTGADRFHREFSIRFSNYEIANGMVLFSSPYTDPTRCSIRMGFILLLRFTRNEYP